MSGWQYTITVAGHPVNVCDALTPLTITHGRVAAGTQPDAPSCTFDWDADQPPGALGDPIQVSATIVDEGPTWVYDAPDNYTYDSAAFVYDNLWAAPAGPRFTGRIHQLEAVEADGIITGYRVTCVGGQADWGYKHLTATRPQETDVARVQAIAAAAGTTVTVLGSQTIMLSADTQDTTALAWWQDVCASSGGLLWQARDGGIRYGAADHRRTNPLGILPCEDIADGLTWTLDMDAVLNHLTVSWGPEGSQTQNTHRDDPSIARWGERHADVPTVCASQADADQLALLILARRAQPYWIMPGVTVDATAAARPVRQLLARLEVGSIILVPIPTNPGPVPVTSYGSWLVEGWTETADIDGHTYLQLHLTDAARWVTTRLRTWQEAKSATWGQEAAGSWLDALIVEGV